jgi:hypothetical protein
MAISWISVLKMVPWSDVINNAPKIAEGARNLWSAVSKKPPELELPVAGKQPEISDEAQSIDILKAQLAAAESAVSDLHNQMLESSELIKALADQNTQLIKRVEVNRVRVLWLAGATFVLAVVSAINLVVIVVR